jgi:taurine dioxygenase
VGYRQIQVEPVTPLIGAEVRGVQLAECDGQAFAEIQQAWEQHLVLVFRDQALDAAELIGFASRLGGLQIHPADRTLPGYPEAIVVNAREHERYVRGRGWHSDVSCDEFPPAATLLHLAIVPPSGGDSLFANMFEAFDRLSPALRSFVSSGTARHESAHIYGAVDGHRPEDSCTGEFPSAVHPMARTHPVMRRKALYVNRGHTTRIDGLYEAESRALLDFLFDHIEQPELQCRLRWTANTLALWDNRCVQHHSLCDYHPHERNGLRMTIVGQRPV